MRLKWAPVDPEWNSGMWNSGQIQSILDGAQDPQQSAVGRLDQGDTRDAAEKAWGATRRATGALILARTGEFPETTAGTTRMLMDLARTSAGLETLAGRCFTRISYPHQLPASATRTAPASTKGCAVPTPTAGSSRHSTASRTPGLWPTAPEPEPSPRICRPRYVDLADTCPGPHGITPQAPLRPPAPRPEDFHQEPGTWKASMRRGPFTACSTTSSPQAGAPKTSSKRFGAPSTRPSTTASSPAAAAIGPGPQALESGPGTPLLRPHLGPFRARFEKYKLYAYFTFVFLDRLTRVCKNELRTSPATPGFRRFCFLRQPPPR